MPDAEENAQEQEGIDPLSLVGSQAHFKGTPDSFLGVSANLLESLVVADYAARLEQELYRKDRTKMSRILGPLPTGEWIACSWPELKHSKHLPSEALQDSKRLSRELTFYAKQQYRKGRQFAMLTLPALDRLSPVFDFEIAHKSASKKAKQVRHLLERNGPGTASVVFERLEGEYRSRKKAIFWHFHMIVELDGGAENFTKLQLFLNDNSDNVSGTWAGVDLKEIKRSRFSSAAFYCAKPCKLAVKIAEMEHQEEFLGLLKYSRKRRMAGRWGGFRDFCRRLSKTGFRVQSSRDDKGDEVLSLVKKAGGLKRDHKEIQSHPVQELVAEDFWDGQDLASNVPHDILDSHCTDLKVSGALGERLPSTEEPEPEYCGTFGPTPGPGNKLYAHIYVRNFTEAAIDQGEGKSWLWHVRESQKDLITAWEANTGGTYDIRAVLKPMAHVLNRLLRKSDSSVYKPTITASFGIQKVLDEFERVPRQVKRHRKQHFHLSFWKPISKFIFEPPRRWFQCSRLSKILDGIRSINRKFLIFLWCHSGRYG